MRLIQEIKEKQNSVLFKTSLMVFTTLVLLTLLSASAFAQDNQRETVRSYIVEQDAEEIEHPVMLVLQRRTEVDQELPMESIKTVIESFAAGEMTQDEVFDAVNGMISLQEEGISAEELEEFRAQLPEDERNGRLIAVNVVELLTAVQEAQRNFRDDKTTEESVGHVLQEMTVFAEQKQEDREEISAAEIRNQAQQFREEALQMASEKSEGKADTANNKVDNGRDNSEEDLDAADGSSAGDKGREKAAEAAEEGKEKASDKAENKN